jgi:hypothetical protein
MTTESSIVKPKARASRNKAKGNFFEWKVARDLGTWIFNDREMLCRHITSGAIKTTWVGDIVPQKNIPTSWNNGIWPWLVECKHGYKGNIPNLINHTIVKTWLLKAYYERSKTQNLLFLITAFHGYSTLLFTDVSFNLMPNLQLNLEIDDNKFVPIYIYDYKKILALNFYSLCEDNKEFFNRLALTQIIH